MVMLGVHSWIWYGARSKHASQSLLVYFTGCCSKGDPGRNGLVSAAGAAGAEAGDEEGTNDDRGGLVGGDVRH